MKKDRNSFFNEFGYNSNMMMPGMGMPNTVSSTSSFYSGPGTPNMNNNMYSDIDSRISKLERRISRLENKINCLDGDNSSYEDNNYTNNMYMV